MIPTVRLDPRSIKNINRALGRFVKATSRASSTAANRAAKSTVAKFSRTVRVSVNVKAARLKKMAKITRATRSNPVARIKVTGAHIPLTDMGARQGKKGVTVKPYRNKGRRTIRRAFIATMASGHKGVYRRTTKKRLPIEESFGPSAINLWEHRSRRLNAFAIRQLKKELVRAIQHNTRRRA